MTTKLTLSVEKTIIEKAKEYAKNSGRSLSDLIESYLESLTLETHSDKKISPKLKLLVGSVKLPKSFDEKKELNKYFKNKHI